MTKPFFRRFKVVQDSRNANCLRLHVSGSQWLKVYGMTPEQAKARADILVEALYDWSGEKGDAA